MADQSSEPIKFYRKSEAFGCFSNFSPHPITPFSIDAATSEHLFQAAKFGRTDPDHARAILATTDPAIAAKMGRDRDHPLDSSWDQPIGSRLFDTDLMVKDAVMIFVVYTKFIQHHDIMAVLKDTGRKQIIECTDNDFYWADGGNGRGKNMLGKILEYVREILVTNVPLPGYIYSLLSDLLTPIR